MKDPYKKGTKPPEFVDDLKFVKDLIESIMERNSISREEAIKLINELPEKLNELKNKQMSKITYLIGDATEPQGEGHMLLPHVVNTWGAWGSGYVLALSRKWKAPEQSYRALTTADRVLGNVQLVEVENDGEGNVITVANMVAQEGCGKDKNGLPPIRYEALKACLVQVNQIAKETHATIHAPRFGAGLSGGDWNIIEQIIKDTIDVDVFIYDLR